MLISMFTQKNIFEYKKKEAGTEVKQPKSIYQFLDSFYPGNYLNAKRNLDACLNEEPQEMILASLAFHFKDLLLDKNRVVNKDYPTWRVAKIKKQSSRFSEAELKEAISSLSLVDKKCKSGEGLIADLLDLFILKKLQ